MSYLDPLWAYHDAYIALQRTETQLTTTEAWQKRTTLYNTLNRLKKDKNDLCSYLDRSYTTLGALEAEYMDLSRRLQLEMSDMSKKKENDSFTSDSISKVRTNFEKLSNELKGLKFKIINVSTSISQASERLTSTLSKGSHAKRDYDVSTKECEQERAKKTPELESLNATLEDLAQKVPQELLHQYKQVLRTHQADPLAALTGSRCSGCNMSLPTLTVSRIDNGNELITCENCGRILFCDKQ